MAFIEVSAPQKNAGKNLSTRFFAAPASTNARRRKSKREKKILNEYLQGKFIILVILHLIINTGYNNI